MKLALKLIPALMLVLVVGCGGDYNIYADKAMDYSCGLEGQAARLTYRTVRTPEFLAKDRAICVRCAGETELSCTGDPIALPLPPT